MKPLRYPERCPPEIVHNIVSCVSVYDAPAMSRVSRAFSFIARRTMFQSPFFRHSARAVTFFQLLLIPAHSNIHLEPLSAILCHLNLHWLDDGDAYGDPTFWHGIQTAIPSMTSLTTITFTYNILDKKCLARLASFVASLCPPSLARIHMEHDMQTVPDKVHYMVIF